MSKIRRYEKLVEDVAKLKNEKAKVDGAIEQISKSLFAEFGVSTIEELKTKLQEMKEAQGILEADIDKEYKQYLKDSERLHHDD